MNAKSITRSLVALYALFAVSVANATLVSFYDFDGQDNTDGVGSNHGVVNSQTGYSANTHDGSGFSLDLSATGTGTDQDYVRVGASSPNAPDFGIGASNAFTISMWVNYDTPGFGAVTMSLAAPFVFEVRDLWPAIFAELGVLRNRFILRSLEGLEMFLYRRSGAVVTVTRGFAENIERRGIEKAKIHFIPNGVDLEAFEPGPPDAELLARLKLTGRFVVLYCGAHGISHALARVLDAAERLQDDSTVHLLFVGEGAEKGRLVEDARQRGLTNVSFLPAVPRQQVPALYRSADVCLVPLKRVPLFRTFIPSKMFEILACGRPIIASVEGEAAQILEESGAALVIPPEDPGLLAESISQLHADAARRETLAGRGRPFVGERYDRKMLAARYLEVLSTLRRAVAG